MGYIHIEDEMNLFARIELKLSKPKSHKGLEIRRKKAYYPLGRFCLPTKERKEFRHRRGRQVVVAAGYCLYSCRSSNRIDRCKDLFSSRS